MQKPPTIIQELIEANPSTERELNNHIRRLCGLRKTPPMAKIGLLSAYHKLLKQGIIKPNPALAKLFKKRAVRTLSGVAPIAVLTKPYPCPGQCVFCPGQKKMPKSYLSNEPAVMRAILCKFDPYKQVAMRLNALKMTGHETDKCELIVMGGTWSYLPVKYQAWFIKRCFDAFNGKTSANLQTAQKLNEGAKFRVIGLTLETRPDYINSAEIKKMRELGCTRVELGAQCLDDKILKLNKRGHNIKQLVNATKLLKDAGFKISFHMMPNLPGSTLKKDLAMFKKLFSDQNFQPDMIKIYPCVITKDAEIYKWYKQGKYRPYSDRELLKLLVGVKKNIPPYVRISRLIRDIPNESIISGNKISNLRQLLAQKYPGICRCIRCREARGKQFTISNLQFSVQKYPAAQGTEYFLSYESKDRKTLFAFLRLRISNKPDANLLKILPELNGAAIIREVHTYGELTPLKSQAKNVQHLGLGKKLILEAEKIARKSGFKKLAVISGIGVRAYYQKLGYRLVGTYMIKKL